MKTISREELQKRLTKESPNGTGKKEGYALINVLSQEDFLLDHIPGSINIPKGSEDEFEKRFDKSKELIVYCGSPQCTASTSVAEALIKKGFTNVIEYEGGMSDWRSSKDNCDEKNSCEFPASSPAL